MSPRIEARQAVGHVRYPRIATGFCAVQQLEVSANNCHNQRLFDDLVGAHQNRWGYRNAERLGGLQVHGHLKFRRQLHREIARLCAAQDAIDISGGTTIEVYLVCQQRSDFAVKLSV